MSEHKAPSELERGVIGGWSGEEIAVDPEALLVRRAELMAYRLRLVDRAKAILDRAEASRNGRLTRWQRWRWNRLIARIEVVSDELEAGLS